MEKKSMIILMVLEIDIKEGLDETNENKMIVQKGGEAMHPALIAGLVVGGLIAIPVGIGIYQYRKMKRQIEEIKEDVVEQIKVTLDELRLETRTKANDMRPEEERKRKEESEKRLYNVLSKKDIKKFNNILNWEQKKINLHITTLTFKRVFLNPDTNTKRRMDVIAEDIVFFTVYDVALSLFFKSFKNSMKTGKEIDGKRLNNLIMSKLHTEISVRLGSPCIKNLLGFPCVENDDAAYKAVNEKNDFIDIVREKFVKMCGGEELGFTLINGIAFNIRLDEKYDRPPFEEKVDSMGVPIGKNVKEGPLWAGSKYELMKQRPPPTQEEIMLTAQPLVEIPIEDMQDSVGQKKEKPKPPKGAKGPKAATPKKKTKAEEEKDQTTAMNAEIEKQEKEIKEAKSADKKAAKGRPTCDIKEAFKKKVDEVICEAVEKIKCANLEDLIVAKLSGGNLKMADLNNKNSGAGINVCKKVLYLRPVNFGLNTSVRLTKTAKMGLTSESLSKIKSETCINLVLSVIKDIVKKIKDDMAKMLESITAENHCGAIHCEGDDTETMVDNIMVESEVSTQHFKKDLEKKSDASHKRTMERVKKRKAEKEENKMKGGAVISKGSYGCIFKPAILCSSGKNSKSKKYISKLMINEPFLNEREIRISELIKQIPEYSKRFSPILSLCDIEIKNIKDKDIKKCDDIIRRGKKYQPVIGKVRLINGKDFHENYKRPDKKKFLQILLKSYPILLESLRLLENKYIVHHDLKSNNIIYDEKNNRPVIIDFGLSFSVENIENLKKAFYVEWAPHWTLWPIEIHYLSFVISKKRNMYEDELISLNKEYNESHTVFVKTARLPDVVKNIFSTESYKMLKFYNSKPVNESIKFIINNYWKTWNNYSLSVTFSMLFLGSIKNVIEINDFNKRFVEILFLNINPNPNLRLSLKKTIEEYKKISLLLNHMDIL